MPSRSVWTRFFVRNRTSRRFSVGEFAARYAQDALRKVGELVERVFRGRFWLCVFLAHWRCTSDRALASAASDACCDVAGEFFVHHALPEDGC